MIASLFLYLVTFFNPACETYAPRLDGTRVTVCDGAVTKVCNAAGACNAFPFTPGIR